MRHVSKPGRAANCAERGAGHIIHAVDRSNSVFDLNVPALCGAKPSGRLGWTDYAALSSRSVPPSITCPKCLAKLPNATRLEFDVWKSDDGRWVATEAVARFVDDGDAPYSFATHVQRVGAATAREALSIARSKGAPASCPSQSREQPL